jgi:hypothetical protein
MLEIHMPHKSLHGLGEFLLHLFTITVGLLIAVQIESFVEWRHHLHLAEEARTALRTEIEHNLKGLKEAQPGLKAWRQQIDADLLAMQRIQEDPDDPKAQHPTLTLNASGISLDDTAWKTAQTTGALAFMPYEEAERYANIYQAQAMLQAAGDKPLEDVAGMIGLVDKYQLGKSAKITREQASEMAERLGRMELHLANGDTLLQAAADHAEAFLQNRKARTTFSDSIH